MIYKQYTGQTSSGDLIDILIIEDVVEDDSRPFDVADYFPSGMESIDYIQDINIEGDNDDVIPSVLQGEI